MKKGKKMNVEKKESGPGKNNKHVKEEKGRQVKQDKRNAGMTEKKSATRRAVEEKHSSKC